MTTYIKRPTSDGAYSGGTISSMPGAATSPPWYTFVNDVSDTSYLRLFGSPNNTMIENVSAISLASGEQIRRYRVVLRWSGSGGGYATLSGSLVDSGGHIGPADTYYLNTGGGVPTTCTGPWRTTAPDGSALTPSAISGIYLQTTNNTTLPVVYDIWVEVETNFAPNATGAALGTLTSTQAPTFTWTYADTEGDVQERYRVKVFNSAQYSAGGFDPNTSSPTIDSGEVFSSATSYSPGTLANNDSYKAFIFVSDANSNGHYGIVTSGGASVSTVTIAVTAPATPVLAGSVDATNMRNALTLSDAQNMLSADDANFEGGIGTWINFLNCAGIAQSASQSFNGTKSLTMFSATSGRMDVATAGGASGYAVLPGVLYSALARFKAGTTGRTVNLYVNWYKSSGAASTVTAQSTIATGADVTSGWTQIAGTATAPSDAAFAQVIASVATQAGSESHFVDTVMIAPGTTTTWAPGGLRPTARVTVQRSVDGGTTWSTLVRPFVTGQGIVDLSQINYDDVTQQQVLYDYEAPRGIAVQYRASVTAGSLVSAWSTAVSLTQSASGWWLKSIYDPTKNWNYHPALENLEFPLSYDEAAGTQHPLGRTREVVESDSVTGAHIPWDATVLSDVEYATYTALRTGLAPMLMQPPWSTEQFYCRFTGAHSVVRIVDGDTSEVKRSVAASLTEIDVP